VPNASPGFISITTASLGKCALLSHDGIDYGSGTGILAIAAVKLGANQAVCVDNDPQAVVATQNNIKNNQPTGGFSSKYCKHKSVV
jgi:ribosomal protein L11 methylase PrmA